MPFEFSLPALNNLSRDQQNAVFKKLRTDDCVVVSGCPGSGKTTVVTFRMQLNQKGSIKYQYLVYAKLLRRFLVNQFDAAGLDSSKVNTIMKWYYRQSGGGFLLTNDFKEVKPGVKSKLGVISQRLNLKELMLDEGQDLPLELLSSFSNLAGSTFICADLAQDVFGRADEFGARYLDELKNKLISEQKKVYHIHLTKNFRNTRDIYAFANSCAPNINAAAVESFARSKGELPKVYLMNSSKEMLDQVVNSIRENPTMNIGVLASSKYNVNLVSKELESNGISHTKYISNDVPDEIRFQRVIVTTFHSCKGLEFDMVIMPFADSIKVADAAGLKRVYVGMTRAKERLRLITSSDILPSFIQTVNKELYDRVG